MKLRFFLAFFAVGNTFLIKSLINFSVQIFFPVGHCGTVTDFKGDFEIF